MLAISFNPIFMTAASAAVVVATPVADPSMVEIDGMQDACDVLANAHDVDGIGTGDAWSGEIVLGEVTYVSGPTEVGSHDINDAIGDPVGSGTFTPAHIEILGNPYRNGGSVNMFGIQQSVGGHYSASEYDFSGEFTTTYRHAFSCDISKAVYHPEEFIPGHKVQGYYVNCDFGHGQGNDNGGADTCADLPATQASCIAHNAEGEAFGQWGEDTEQCKFIKTGDAVDEETIDEYWEDPLFVVNEAGTPIDVEQTDTLVAHENAGEGFDTSETLIIGQVVICISPSTTTKKLPGAWRAQNGYDGGSMTGPGAGCNTSWYNGGATVGVPNLNDGSHNWVTVPVI